MEFNFKKPGVIYNKDIENSEKLAQKIACHFNNAVLADIKHMPADIDFAMITGGDGTLLRCARFYSQFDTPVFGFNMGRLGFLAQALPNEIETAIKKIKSGDFRIEERLMLQSTENNTAINDMVIKNAPNSRIVTLNLFINDNPVCSYLADGLIISTPTGSTAYSLSAGGPVLTPELECIVIVPICPHTLNARPIVVNSSEKITIKMRQKTEYQIIADGQDTKNFNQDITVCKHNKSAKLVLLNEFYAILREKLHWGVAPNKC